LGAVDRPQFFSHASRMIREILVDHAKKKLAKKRGGGMRRTTLHDGSALTEGKDVVELLDLDEALNRLEELDPELCRVVDLRFFGGLTGDEIAPLLSVTTRTVDTYWRSACAWLRRELARGDRE